MWTDHYNANLGRIKDRGFLGWISNYKFIKDGLCFLPKITFVHLRNRIYPIYLIKNNDFSNRYNNF